MPTSDLSPANGPGRNLVRRFPLKRFVLASTMLLALVVLGFTSLNLVKGKAHGIIEVTLPDLSEAGMATADLTEDFNRTLLMATAASGEERTRYGREAGHFADESRQLFDLYGKGVFAPGDHMNFERLRECQTNYFAIRRQVYDLADADKKQEAIALCRSSLLPSYKAYDGAGEVLLGYNINRGEARGESILRFCRFTQYAVAGCVVALFVLGFIIGVFK
jgi:hypothetical protein